MKINVLPVFVVAACSAVSALGGIENDPTASLRAWRGDKPGGVVAAVVTREGTRFYAAGVFDRATPKPVGEDTFFEIGSVTKTFTSLLLADAVKRGEVKLEDAIAKRGGLNAPASMTFEQLATHHSGLPRLPGTFAPANPADPYADQDETKLLAALQATTLREPGGRFEYSNFGAAVLGAALGRTIGKPYATLLRERVLEPLGMNESTLDWHSAGAGRLAPGHAMGEEVPNWSFSAYGPAGAIVSTARDLAKYVEAALGLRGTSLNDALAMCIEPRADTDSSSRRIGLAWMIERRPSGASVVWHNGGTGGYRSFVGLDRTAGRGVVLLTNHEVGLESLGFALLAGEAWKADPAPAAASKNLAVYVGRYPLAPSFVMAVTAEGNQLFVQATGQPRLALRAEGPDHFAVEGVEAAISFVRDAAGNVIALVLHQNGMDQRAPRREKDPPPPAEVTLDAETLAEYAGRYPLAPGFDLVVTIENKAVFVQATGQPKLPVFARAKDQFFYKAVDAQLTFERDAAGKVVRVVLHQNGRDLPGPRQ